LTLFRYSYFQYIYFFKPYQPKGLYYPLFRYLKYLNIQFFKQKEQYLYQHCFSPCNTLGARAAFGAKFGSTRDNISEA
jgi:hypothetical protein